MTNRPLAGGGPALPTAPSKHPFGGKGATRGYLVAALVLFAGSRAPAGAPDWRPRFHFTAAAGWASDPNGLYFYQGRWQLHYQYQWPRQWGYANSRDLIHWEPGPVALVPDALGDCWSGCAVLDPENSSGLFPNARGGPVLFYTAQNAGNGQRIALAYRTESGGTWHRYAGNPVLRGPTKDFRDPSVFWHAATGRWVMVLSEGTHLTLFTSPNLRVWTEASRLDVEREARDAAVECPGLFEIPVEGTAVTRWVLAYSNVSQRIFATPPEFGVCAQRYIVGTFDGRVFRPSQPPQPLGAGPDDYASVVWPREEAGARRRIMIGWMSHWGYAKDRPTAPWQGCLTIPRELTLRTGVAGNLILSQQPVRELAGSMDAVSSLKASEKLSAGQTYPIGSWDSGAIRLRARLTPDSRLELGLLGSGATEVTVGYDGHRGVLFLDRSHAGPVPAPPHFARAYEVPYALPPSGELGLQVLFDRSTVEVFTDEGSVYLSALAFPPPGADTIAVRAAEGPVTLTALDALRWRP